MRHFAAFTFRISLYINYIHFTQDFCLGEDLYCPGDSVPLRSTPAPPIVSCVLASKNLYTTGPSPYTCPGVDTPPDNTNLLLIAKSLFSRAGSNSYTGRAYGPDITVRTPLEERG